MRRFIEQALQRCLNVSEGERVCIITDTATEAIGQQFRDTVGDMDCTAYHFNMDHYGERSDDGENPLQFPDVMRKFMEQSAVSIYAAENKAGELQSFRAPMIGVVKDSGRIRHGHMPFVTPEVLELGFGDDYEKVIDLTTRVQKALQGATGARVTTDLGTDLTVTFSPKHLWVPSTGVVGPGEYGNIPSGEVYTCVANANGVIIVDGILGDYFNKKYGLLKDSPVEMIIADGYVQSVECPGNAQLEDELQRYMQGKENGNRVGEWAVGTNPFVTRLIGNMLIDEKIIGNHIAIGSGYKDKTGCDWDGPNHLDCVILNPRVDVEFGKQPGEFTVHLLRDGEFYFLEP